MGSLDAGVDRSRQRRWLTERHVHRQEPCRGCWARYLCGGGCHHEVIHRGRPACDYIRGWLHYCLGAYLRLSRLRCERAMSGPLSVDVLVRRRRPGRKHARGRLAQLGHGVALVERERFPRPGSASR